MGPFVECGEVRLFFDSNDHDGRPRHGEVQVEVEYLILRVEYFQLGLGRACGLGVKLLQGRVVGGHVVSTAFFV